VSRARQHALMAVFGLALGYALTRIGFGDFGEVHRLFLLQDLRLLYTFAGAVALCLPGFALLGRFTRFTPRPLEKGTLPGGALFGLGWALTGACPAAALVQLGNGRLAAIATLTGIAAGSWLYGRIQSRWLHWDAGSCAD
jgi:uncharacterized membrane protein YedE/YeeE